ncbi:MAG: hypothetical protein NVSMB6_23910 [Burkholderiaceae bacterium]
MGSGYWFYGVDANRCTLEAFVRHRHAQGQSLRLVTADEPFPPATSDSFKN